MSLLCKYIFGILVIKLGLNPHGFNLEADNQSCNQKPVIGTQARVFLCLCKWHKHVWLCVLHKAAGLFARDKTSDRTREVFLREPLPVINQKSQHRGDEGCPCPRAQGESCGCLLMVPSLLPCPQVPAQWEGSGRPAPSPSGGTSCHFRKENQWFGLHGGLDLDMGTRAMACTILLPSCTDPAGDGGRDMETRSRAGQPGCMSPRQMGFHRRRFTT